MYLRVISILLIAVAAAIVGAMLRPTPPPGTSPPALPALPASALDGGLSRVIDRLSFAGVPRRRAIEAIRDKAGISLNILDGMPEEWNEPVTLSLKNVTVEVAIRVVTGNQMAGGTIDGEAVAVNYRSKLLRSFHAYNVNNLVSKPTAALQVSTAPWTPLSLVRTGGGGAHGAPLGVDLPPLEDEPELADALNKVLRINELDPQKQTLPGRLLGLLTFESDQRIRAALAQIRHPVGLDTDDHPKPALERRIQLDIRTTPLDRAIEMLGDAAGANVIVQWDYGAGGVLNRNALISERCDGMKLQTALSDVIRRVWGGDATSFAFETDDDIIAAGVFSGGEVEPVLRTYDVSGILRRFGAAFGLPNSAAPEGSPALVRRREKSLVDLVAKNARFRSDKSPVIGGSRVIRAFRGRLLVSQTPENQRAVWEYLHRLQEQGPAPRRQ